MRFFLGLIVAASLFSQGRNAQGDEGKRLPSVSSLERSDWQVRRRVEDVDARIARNLKMRPWRDDLAIRLIRGRSSKVVESWLQRFERDAEERPADLPAQLAHAQLLLAAHRWADAEVRFGKATQIDAANFASRWGRARALQRTGARRTAVVELRMALSLARAPKDIDRVGRELIRLAQSERDVEAEIEGRQALVRRGTAEPAILELAVALNAAGRSLPAAELLATHLGAVVRSEEKARWLMIEGQYRAAAGDLSGASSVLAEARKAAVDLRASLRHDIWSAAIDIARQGGTLDRLKGELTTPTDVVEWEARARVDDAAGDWSGGLAAYAEAIRRSPRDVTLRQLQIGVARRVANNQEVARLYTALAAVAAQPGRENVTAAIEALDGLWQLGFAQQAGAAFDRLLAAWGRGLPILRAMAESATRWGDDHRAETCWTVLLKRVPGDEAALVAVGELQLQQGQRRLAAETWRKLVRGSGRTRADAHARVAEILVDHDCLEPAFVEARAAIDLFSGEARYHRTMAAILERQGRVPDAEREWGLVLRGASGPQRAAEKKEARARLVTLWSRAGNGRVQEKLREMEETLRRDSGDRETLTFLVEAQLKTGNMQAAIARLTAYLSEAHGDADADVELILLLVRTLRQAHRLDDAMAWLEQLVRRFPERAREARLQLADVALGAHDDERAQEFASQAATSDPSDPRVVLRAAAVEERLGHWREAGAMYRRIVGVDRGENTAALAWASLLSRLGDVDEQRTVLRDVLFRGTDPDAIALAGTRSITLEEAAGTLEDAESLLAATPDLNAPLPEAAARRTVLAAMLWRLAPPLYRRQWLDPSSLARLRVLARHGMRPLLELINAPDAEPDPHAVEVLGMLGRAEAASGLARILASETEAAAPTSLPTARSRLPVSDEVISLTVVALGRLGGDVARGALESFEQHLRPSARPSLLWALGRVGGERASQIAKREISRKTSEATILGCLTLGRAGGVDAESVLLAVAADPTEPTSVRVAAILGLGLGAHVDASPAIIRFADSADQALAHAARTALGWLGGRTAGESPSSTMVAVAVDEAVAIRGGQVDAEVLIRALLAPQNWGDFDPVAEPGMPSPSGDGAAPRDVP